MVVSTLPGTHPRSLTVNHAVRVVNEARGFKIDDGPERLPPNHMRLFSYYKPSLEAGLYSIKAEQLITSDEHHPNAAKSTAFLHLWNHEIGKLDLKDLKPQLFNVVAPQFSIDPKLINSYYPPDGHQDEARILPHIVFNDPHLPWERDAGETVQGEKDPDMNADGTPHLDENNDPLYRSMVPWMALLVFDPEDLRLDLSEVQALKLPAFPDKQPDLDTAMQKRAPTGIYPMSIKDYLALEQSSRINYEAGYNSQGTLDVEWTGADGLASNPDLTNIVFPKKSLFRDIFASTDKKSHNIESHKYTAHVRQVNTVGFPDAGVEADGLFSIVVSRRTGNYNATQPTSQICHLVSIEHVDSTWSQVNDFLNKPENKDSNARIGMVSLYSWIYTSLPPNPVDFIDTMMNLMKTQQMLRVGQTAIQGLQDSISAQALVQQPKPPIAVDAIGQTITRLKLGYTLARWRTETGEEVAAFNRGPLVPQPVTWPPALDWAGSSNTSKEYQILDEQTGLMDLSYSSAWQLGKLLAISDSVFNAALMRFRSLVHGQASSGARKKANGVPDANDTVKRVAELLDEIRARTNGRTGLPQRTRPLPKDRLKTDLSDPRLAATFRQQLDKVVQFQGSAEDDIYDEFNTKGSNNSDWVTIFNWISEKLYLSDIPAHYLIPDPSYLPSEALRFFFIDDAWLDCLIDGALSVANHLEGDSDYTRFRIKQTYNVYLDKIITDAKCKPQIPCSGFILKSALVKVMPDLRITVSWKGRPDPNRSTVCRYTKLDETTILCLLDGFPEELDSITLAQPPHQQRFSVGHRLEPGSPKANPPTGPVLEFQLRQLYTKTGKVDTEWPSLPNESQPSSATATNWFDFPSRCIRADEMATEINKILQTGFQTTDEYIDLVPTSSVLGLELNDPCYYFVVVPRTPTAVAPQIPTTDESRGRDRQLWVGINPPSPPSIPDSQPPSEPHSIPKGVYKTPAKHQFPKPLPQHDVLSPSKANPSYKQIPQTLADYTAGQTFSRTQAVRNFTVYIWADYKGFPLIPKANRIYSPSHYIPTLNEYFFDLTISIRKGAPSQARLKEIGIAIPTDGIYEVKPDNKRESLLTKNYDGPGAYMLSNQRFIPYINFTIDYLQIRLVPRSASSSPFMILDDDRSKDVSFRLAEANISDYHDAAEGNLTLQDDKTAKQFSEKRTVAVVNVYERYADVNGGADLIFRDTVNVVKNKVKDPNR